MAKSRIGSLNSTAKKLESQIKRAQFKAQKKREVEQKVKLIAGLRKKLSSLKK